MRAFLVVFVLIVAAAGLVWLEHRAATPQPGLAATAQPAGTQTVFGRSGTLPLSDSRLPDAWLNASRPANEFWQHDSIREADRIERILAAEESLRAALIARFGADVREAPLLWPLFRPLHDRMPELTSQQQIEIHTLEQRFSAQSLRAQNVTFQEHRQRIAARLGADVARRYALHASPFARELRGLDEEYSQQRFSEAFAALDALHSAADGDSFVAARARLRDLLGNERLASLWSARDPRFARFEALGARYALTPQTLISAYALILENEDAMLRIAASTDQTRRQSLLREQHETGRRRLRELVGADAADALMNASSAPPAL